METVRRFFIRVGMFVGPEIREFTFFYTNDFLGAIPTFFLVLIYLVLTIPWLTLVILSPVGFWYAREKGFVVLALIFILGYSIPHFLILAEPRFHLGIVPVIIPFAAYTVEKWKELKNHHFIFQKDWLFLLIYLTILICFGITLFHNLNDIRDVFNAGGNTLRYSY